MRSINNEKGFVSLIVAAAVVGVGSLVVLQTSVAFRNNQAQHRKERVKANAHIHLLSLVQRTKRGHDLAQLRPDCDYGSAGLRVKELPGSTEESPRIMCIPRQEYLCVTNPNMIGDNTPMCSPMTAETIDWQQGFDEELPEVEIRRLSSSGTYGASPGEDEEDEGRPMRATSFQIPNPNNSADPRSGMWKNCEDSTCVRMVLCPLGETSCAAGDTQGVQIIRLGSG